MTSITELRQRFPQYDDMSDDQFADAFHNKYYSDIPKNKFYEKIGLSLRDENKVTKETKGAKGILNDVYESIRNIPSDISSMAHELPGQIKESAVQLGSHPIRAFENVGAGLLEGLKGAVNIPANVASYLSEKNIGRGALEDFIKKLKIGETGLEEAVLGEEQPGDVLLRGLGSFAPYAKLGGITKGLGGAAKRAGVASAYATGQNENPLEAALLGALGEGATRGAQKVFNKNTYLPNTPLSEEQLQNALNVTKGTKTDIGNVIENPFLKRQFENVLPEIPFSGANKKMQATASGIENKANELLNSLKGDYEGANLGQSIQEALKQSEKEVREIKNKKFNELNQAAENEGVSTSRNSLVNEAKNKLDEINSDKHLSLLSDKNTIKLLQDIINEKKDKNFSLKNTDILRGKLGDKAHDAYISGNTEMSNIFKSLRDAASKDINDAIDNSGRQNLKDLRDTAFNYYKKEYVPFEDSDIMKFTRKGADTDTLVSSFIKNSRTSDRANLLSKLTQKLPKEDRDLLAYAYFSRAIKDNELNPQSLKTLYKSLGTKQKEALLSKEMINKFSALSDLSQKNSEALNIMFNPKTGQRNSSTLLGAGLPALGTGIGALATGSVPFTLLGGAIPTLLARPLTNLLTNERAREAIVNSILKQKSKNPPRNLAPFVQSIIESSNRKPLELEVNEFSGYE